MIARLRIASMPVTLATYIALLGLTYAMSGGLSKSYPNSDATLWVDQPLAGVFSPRSLLTLDGVPDRGRRARLHQAGTRTAGDRR